MEGIIGTYNSFYIPIDNLAAIFPGQLGSVCTFYEIVNAPDKEFCGIDQDVLLKALRRLEQRKKAEVIHMDDGNGVKFF